MTQVLEDKNAQLASFTSLAKPLASPLPWLEKLRRSGIARFGAVGFPSTKEEEWRFTNVAPIAQTAFKLGLREESAAAADLASGYSIGREAAAEIVIVNGHFSASLSKLGKLPKGVTVTSLAEALKQTPALVEAHLSRYAGIEKDAFVALNTGFLRDGAFVHFARGATVKQPIHLLFVSVPSSEPWVAYPRVLMVAEDHVQATVVESYAGGGAGVYFNDAVTEIVLGENSFIDHCKLEQETLEAYHIAAMHVELGRASSFVSHAASIGGKLVRNDLSVALNGEGAEATLNGLVVIDGDQHVDNHTLLRHEKPNCPSHELYKNVLGGRASGVFKGKIYVQKDAQKTDAKQTNKTLLLSDDATMNAMPALEIYADDVKCTHGSTTGPVDEEMVFYLETRGVSHEAARHLLTYAFAADITRRIKVEAVRRRIEDFMAAQHGLPQDLRITDLGS
ncbi:MAG TPA: Fe-S cluster assembly protein SufD, partial [Tepidisphaeraceae bacterium]|nr:Fe-S cluster assembly protein SufD [Tepidisphaeraceae bacterium]